MSEFSEFMLLVFSSPWGFLYAAIFGLLWGSFANVCIYRIPQKESILFPKSHCPSCKQAVRPYDNIPLFSWFLLRGKCRFCKWSIPIRYPLVESLSMFLSLALYWHFVWKYAYPISWFLLGRYLIYFFFSILLLILSLIDWKYKILPNLIIYPAIPVFFLLGRALSDVSFWDASLGLIVGYLAFRFISDGYYFVTKREGLGYGDGKLLSLIGALLGIKSLIPTIFIGSVLGIVVTLAFLKKAHWKYSQKEANLSIHGETSSLRYQEIPFGPFLSLGALAHLFLFTGFSMEERILSWFF